MSSRPEAVAVADDVWEEMVKHVVLTVPLTPQNSLSSASSAKLLSSGISRAIEAATLS